MSNLEENPFTRIILYNPSNQVDNTVNATPLTAAEQWLSILSDRQRFINKIDRNSSFQMSFTDPSIGRGSMLAGERDQIQLMNASGFCTSTSTICQMTPEAIEYGKMVMLGKLSKNMVLPPSHNPYDTNLYYVREGQLVYDHSRQTFITPSPGKQLLVPLSLVNYGYEVLRGALEEEKKSVVRTATKRSNKEIITEMINHISISCNITGDLQISSYPCEVTGERGRINRLKRKYDAINRTFKLTEGKKGKFYRNTRGDYLVVVDKDDIEHGCGFMYNLYEKRPCEPGEMLPFDMVALCQDWGRRSFSALKAAITRKFNKDVKIARELMMKKIVFDDTMKGDIRVDGDTIIYGTECLKSKWNKSINAIKDNIMATRACTLVKEGGLYIVADQPQNDMFYHEVVSCSPVPYGNPDSQYCSLAITQPPSNFQLNTSPLSYCNDTGKWVCDTQHYNPVIAPIDACAQQQPIPSVVYGCPQFASPDDNRHIVPTADVQNIELYSPVINPTAVIAVGNDITTEEIDNLAKMSGLPTISEHPENYQRIFNYGNAEHISKMKLFKSYCDLEHIKSLADTVSAVENCTITLENGYGNDYHPDYHKIPEKADLRTRTIVSCEPHPITKKGLIYAIDALIEETIKSVYHGKDADKYVRMDNVPDGYEWKSLASIRYDQFSYGNMLSGKFAINTDGYNEDCVCMITEYGRSVPLPGQDLPIDYDHYDQVTANDVVKYQELIQVYPDMLKEHTVVCYDDTETPIYLDEYYGLGFTLEDIVYPGYRGMLSECKRKLIGLLKDCDPECDFSHIQIPEVLESRVMTLTPQMETVYQIALESVNSYETTTGKWEDKVKEFSNYKRDCLTIAILDCVKGELEHRDIIKNLREMSRISYAHNYDIRIRGLHEEKVDNRTRFEIYMEVTNFTKDVKKYFESFTQFIEWCRSSYKFVRNDDLFVKELNTELVSKKADIKYEQKHTRTRHKTNDDANLIYPITHLKMCHILTVDEDIRTTIGPQLTLRQFNDLVILQNKMRDYKIPECPLKFFSDYQIKIVMGNYDEPLDRVHLPDLNMQYSKFEVYKNKEVANIPRTEDRIVLHGFSRPQYFPLKKEVDKLHDGPQPDPETSHPIRHERKYEEKLSFIERNPRTPEEIEAALACDSDSNSDNSTQSSDSSSSSSSSSDSESFDILDYPPLESIVYREPEWEQSELSSHSGADAALSDIEEEDFGYHVTDAETQQFYEPQHAVKDIERSNMLLDTYLYGNPLERNGKKMEYTDSDGHVKHSFNEIANIIDYCYPVKHYIPKVDDSAEYQAIVEPQFIREEELHRDFDQKYDMTDAHRYRDTKYKSAVLEYITNYTPVSENRYDLLKMIFIHQMESVRNQFISNIGYTPQWMEKFLDFNCPKSAALFFKTQFDKFIDVQTPVDYMISPQFRLDGKFKPFDPQFKSHPYKVMMSYAHVFSIKSRIIATNMIIGDILTPRSYMPDKYVNHLDRRILARVGASMYNSQTLYGTSKYILDDSDYGHTDTMHLNQLLPFDVQIEIEDDEPTVLFDEDSIISRYCRYAEETGNNNLNLLLTNIRTMTLLCHQYLEEDEVAEALHYSFQVFHYLWIINGEYGDILAQEDIKPRTCPMHDISYCELNGKHYRVVISRFEDITSVSVGRLMYKNEFQEMTEEMDLDAITEVDDLICKGGQIAEYVKERTGDAAVNWCNIGAVDRYYYEFVI